ncbi:hypothetical protein CYMTET_53154 [Cymbomonas tetramitiformis]|uniref:Uncharacterized protein n=1 Tax=Cymbomonas tetramitiformis TaxID=36881 RepID=A0AAE0EQW3_9CHLO|nr:hypothetical protein CYMTET_53154 [Cymbomonas tetramitiformis]
MHRTRLHRIHRWDYAYTSIQGVGYLADPEFWDMDTMNDDETMSAFDTLVDKTHGLPDILTGEALGDPTLLAEYDRQVELQETKRANCAVQLLQYKNKQGIFARASTQLNARRMSAVEFWQTYGRAVPDLKPVFVRATGQVSGACASERGHKVMNFVQSEGRNRLGNQKMNNLVYIHWNLNQLDKVEEVEFNGPKVIAWTEGQESSEGWVDAWQDANREANEQEFTANAQSRQTRAVNRAERVSAVVAARLAPTVGPEDEDVHSADEDDGGEQGEAFEARAAPAATTRFGRTIRRPASLNTFYD